MKIIIREYYDIDANFMGYDVIGTSHIIETHSVYEKLNETFDMTKDDLKILATDGECVVNDKTSIPSFLVVKSAPHMGL
jgi:hypothetical protein